MTSLAKAISVLDAPRKANRALAENHAKRLAIIEHAEEQVRTREFRCAAKEAFLKQTVDASANPQALGRMVEWFEVHVLPSLVVPAGCAGVTAALETRAAELDELLLDLEDREMALQDAAEELALRSSEVTLREEDAVRRLQESAKRVGEAEHHAMCQTSVWRSAWDARLEALAQEERATRNTIAADWRLGVASLLSQFVETRSTVSLPRQRVAAHRSRSSATQTAPPSRVDAGAMTAVTHIEPTVVSSSWLSVEGDAFDPEVDDANANARDAELQKAHELARRERDVEAREREISYVAEYVMSQRHALDRISHELLSAAEARGIAEDPRRQRRGDADGNGDGAFSQHPLLTFTRLRREAPS